MFTSYATHIKMHSLFVPVNSQKHGWYRLAWTGLSWPAGTRLSTGLFMDVETVLFMADDRTGLNSLEQHCLYMIHVVRAWWNNKVEQRCYNSHELVVLSWIVNMSFTIHGSIKLVFACSNMNNCYMSIQQACHNMLKHVLEQCCYFNSPDPSCWQCWTINNLNVTACEILTCVPKQYRMLGHRFI